MTPNNIEVDLALVRMKIEDTLKVILFKENLYLFKRF